MKSGECRHNSLVLIFRIFSVAILCLFGIFYTLSTEIVWKIYTKLTTIGI